MKDKKKNKIIIIWNNIPKDIENDNNKHINNIFRNKQKNSEISKILQLKIKKIIKIKKKLP